MKEVKIHINRTYGPHTQGVNDTRDVFTNRRMLSTIAGSSLAGGLLVSAIDHTANPEGFNFASFAAEAIFFAGYSALTMPAVIYMISRCRRAAGVEVNDGDEVDIRGSAISPDNVRRSSDMSRGQN